MSGIAEVLLTLGYNVTGSDLHESEATRRLESLGAHVRIVHDESNVSGADDGDGVEVVVISSAVDDQNPEVRAAKRLRIPVIARAEMLAELMRVKCGVAVAGAHGKTTTTSLVATVLGAGGFDPTVVIGGRLRALGGTNARLGRSRYMVAEADESDGSFLLLKPTVAVVTNIDREHMSYYVTMERLVEAYVAFIDSVPFYGRAVLCTDCPRIAGVIETGRLKKRYWTYGTGADADFRAVEIAARGTSTSFEVIHRGVALGRAHIGMPGRHTVLNALAAIATGTAFGVPFARIVEALEAFDGIMRRFEIKGEAGGVLVVDDYGHHPTEVKATLAAARGAYDGRRIVALFQPHRYSRTADLFEEFTAAFPDADVLVVTDVYAAGEAAMAGIDGATLAAAIAQGHPGKVVYLPKDAGLAAAVASLAAPGDVVLTLGAGDVTKLGPEILACLGGTEAGESPVFAATSERIGAADTAGRLRETEPASAARKSPARIGG
jgi:UDP-N-acetylmuramate--alanine ligase